MKTVRFGNLSAGPGQQRPAGEDPAAQTPGLGRDTPREPVAWTHRWAGSTCRDRARIS